MKTETVCGITFAFNRKQCPRSKAMYWEVSLAESGFVFDCFPGKTLDQKIQSIKDAARLCGAERFQRDTYQSFSTAAGKMVTMHTIV